MALNLGIFRDMPTAEFKALSNAALSSMRDEMLPHLRTPVPCTDANCADRDTVHIMFVRHGDGKNCKLVSPDGNPANIIRVPLLTRNRKPISRLFHSQIDWSAARPDRLGFEILMFTGWWAKKLDLSTVRSPQLSDAVKWTDEQRQSWESMRRRWIHTQPKQRPVAMFTRNEAA